MKYNKIVPKLQTRINVQAKAMISLAGGPVLYQLNNMTKVCFGDGGGLSHEPVVRHAKILVAMFCYRVYTPKPESSFIRNCVLIRGFRLRRNAASKIELKPERRVGAQNEETDPFLTLWNPFLTTLRNLYPECFCRVAFRVRMFLCKWLRV